MNKNTVKLTTGAMFIAIFTMILIINRQTGMMLEEVFMFILPIPMVAYSTKYGMRSGVPVMIGMILMSLLFGTITTIFYAASQCALGLVFGTCLNKKVDANKTLLLVVLLSMIFNLLCTVIMAPIFGFNLSDDIAAFREMFEQMSVMMDEMGQNYSQYAQGFEIFKASLTDDYILRMIVISMAITGLMQGYIVYTLTILILKRMRYPLPAPKSLYEFYPPVWSGVLAAVAAYGYVIVSVKPLENKILHGIVQSAGICGTFFLMFCGFMALMLIMRRFVKNKLLSIILVIMLFFTFYIGVMILGLLYVITDYHRLYMEGKL